MTLVPLALEPACAALVEPVPTRTELPGPAGVTPAVGVMSFDAGLLAFFALVEAEPKAGGESMLIPLTGPRAGEASGFTTGGAMIS